MDDQRHAFFDSLHINIHDPRVKAQQDYCHRTFQYRKGYTTMEFQMSPFYIATFTLLGILLVFNYTKRCNKTTLPFPPGPPGEFILGHLRVIPFEDPFKSYLDWGKEYSNANHLLSFDALTVFCRKRCSLFQNSRTAHRCSKQCEGLRGFAR